MILMVFLAGINYGRRRALRDPPGLQPLHEPLLVHADGTHMEFIEDHEISNPSSDEMMDMIHTGGETGHMGSEEEEEKSEASIEEDWPDRPHTKETSFLLSTHRA